MSEKSFTLSIVLTTTSLPLWSVVSMNLTDSADSDHTGIDCSEMKENFWPLKQWPENLFHFRKSIFYQI